MKDSGPYWLSTTKKLHFAAPPPSLPTPAVFPRLQAFSSESYSLSLAFVTVEQAKSKLAPLYSSDRKRRSSTGQEVPVTCDMSRAFVCVSRTTSHALLTRPVTLRPKNGAGSETRPRKFRSAVHSAPPDSAADGATAALGERGEGFRWRIRFGSGVELYTNGVLHQPAPRAHAVSSRSGGRTTCGRGESRCTRIVGDLLIELRLNHSHQK